MNSKIEEELNLPSLKDALDQIHNKEQDNENNNSLDFSNNPEEYQKFLDKTKKLEEEIIDWHSIENHDKEMDEISNKAMNSYHDLMDLGMNFEAKHSAQAFEPAVNMLKLALEARNSKNEKKLRLMRLQLEKSKLEHKMKQDGEKITDAGEGEDSITIDRNKILDIVKQENKK